MFKHSLSFKQITTFNVFKNHYMNLYSRTNDNLCLRKFVNNPFPVSGYFSTNVFYSKSINIFDKFDLFKKYHRTVISRCNSIYTSKNVLINDNHFDNGLQKIIIKFPNPKSTLNSFYTVVSNELKSSYDVKPIYKIAPHKKGDRYHEWTCTYHIKWPKDIKVVGTSITKAEASKKAAAKVLYLLSEEGKILNNGQPLIYDKESFNKITKRNYVPLELDYNTEAKLQKICDIYEHNLKKYLCTITSNDIFEKDEGVNNTEDEFFNTWSIKKQRNQRIDKYYAKESVNLPIQEHR